VDGVDNRAEIREFLASRRAKITPEHAGLPAGGGKRRVPGLRREEVAVLAGVSTEWYIRLEKGHISGVSDEVLDAVARALRLDEAERLHLFNLAQAAKPSRTRRRTQPTVRPSVLRILESMASTPAFVRNGRLDVLAINPLGRALYSSMFDDPTRPANLARFAFLDPVGCQNSVNGRDLHSCSRSRHGSRHHLNTLTVESHFLNAFKSVFTHGVDIGRTRRSVMVTEFRHPQFGCGPGDVAQPAGCVVFLVGPAGRDGQDSGQY
jgi:transcriptional regulator with XRE-family HTH domain